MRLTGQSISDAKCLVTRTVHGQRYVWAHDATLGNYWQDVPADPSISFHANEYDAEMAKRVAEAIGGQVEAAP